MDAKRRRPVMMIIVLVTGTMLIMLNLPLIIVILGTLMGGALGLFITGSVSLKREKKEKKEKKEKPPKEKKEKKEKKSLFSGLKGAVERDRKEIAKGSKEEEIKKIDEMIDHAIEGEAAVETAGVAEQVEKVQEIPEQENEEDLLLTLSEEDFGEDIFDEIMVGEDEDELPDTDEDEFDKQLLIGGADSVDDILAAHAAELEDEDAELPDIGGVGGDEEISSLDALDLDEESLLAASLEGLELDEEEEPEEEGYPVGEPEEMPEESEAVEEMEENVSGELEMISFASGVEDDEMISELKSQKKKKKQEVDLSLVRELRDVKIDVTELGEEMEEVLGFLDKKKEEAD